MDHQLGYGYVLDPQEMVAHRYELNGAGPSYVARLSAQANGSALLSPDPKQPAEVAANSASPRHLPPKHRTGARTLFLAPRPSVSGLHGLSRLRERRQTPALSAPAFCPQDSGFASAPTMRIDQPFLAAPNPVRTENLGEQMILGFRARGTRVITTLPAGQIGNDRPIDIVSEQWFSPELELVMRSMHHDPWAGEFTTTVTRVSRGDQPASLFEVPAPYKIIDAARKASTTSSTATADTLPAPRPGSSSDAQLHNVSVQLRWCSSWMSYSLWLLLLLVEVSLERSEESPAPLKFRVASEPQPAIDSYRAICATHPS